jgi:phosphoribosylformylglycinamidine cyclo-ligase
MPICLLLFLLKFLYKFIFSPAGTFLGKSYKDAGVDISAADTSIANVKSLIRSTFSDNVLSDIGLFGAFYKLDTSAFQEPVLVSSVDGVGTKLKIAFLTGNHRTIGSDLVNHCVNDIAVCGAIPLFFMDYYAAGKLSPSVFEDIIAGFVDACRENSCALIGGETAEMPGLYREQEYDLAGMIVGMVDKSRIINGSGINIGDVLIGLPSTGLHTNGYSLARAVLLNKYSVDSYLPDLGCTLGEELLRVHRSYLRPIRELIRTNNPAGFSHITGGGIVGNTTRIIPEGMQIRIDWNAWNRYPIFDLIQKSGEVEEEEMRRAFNLGIGLVAVVHKTEVQSALQTLSGIGENPVIIGEVIGQS